MSAAASARAYQQSASDRRYNADAAAHAARHPARASAPSQVASSTWRDIPELVRAALLVRVQELTPSHPHRKRFDVYSNGWRCVRCGQPMQMPLSRVGLRWLARRPVVARIILRLHGLLPAPVQVSALSNDDRSLLEGARMFLDFIAAHPPQRWPGEPL